MVARCALPWRVRLTNQLWQAPHNKDETPERLGRLADETFEDQARHGSEGTDHG